MSGCPIIDVWAQPLTKQFSDLMPETTQLMIASGAEQYRSVTLSVEDTLAMMDEGGVSNVMMSAWYKPDGSAPSSNESVENFTQHPSGRFFGLLSVNLHDPVDAVKTIDRYAKVPGFVGLRIVPWVWNLPPNHKFYYPLFVKLCELDLPFCTQVGHTGPLRPSETGRPIPYIDEIALQFPQLKIVCGHIGYPWTTEMIAVAWKHQNVFIDTSAYTPAAYPPELVEFMKTKIGMKKVMFGSNFPQLTWKKLTRQLDRLGLPRDVLEHFLYKNAERVFKVKASVSPNPLPKSRL
eukprot:c17445_g1_i1.p1 GENE.c17445_g1_i1~~c17445_g1_i1.p1  ORF type:complete len:292 (-),score=37.63 c17445_g1_i1:260-1135(-)